MAPVLTLDNINQAPGKCFFPWPSAVTNRFGELLKQFEQGKKLPFDEPFNLSIGMPHAAGQRPIRFVRQVLALTCCPELFDDPSFPEDAKARARSLLDACPGNSIGACCEPEGLQVVREETARYIQQRDGIPADPENIFLTVGASDGIMKIIRFVDSRVEGKQSGILVPIPQYQAYSCIAIDCGCAEIPYYLDESKEWSVNVQELDDIISKAKKTCIPRAIAVINPGNPTGAVLTRKNLEDIVKLAFKHNILIIADEVYQLNVYYEHRPFISLKKIMHDMKHPYDKMPLVSLMTVSKGLLGECGIRGGSLEFINIDAETLDQFRKLQALTIAPIPAQVLFYCMVKPPVPGEPSFEEYQKEVTDLKENYKTKMTATTDFFNSLEGVTCAQGTGSMFLFPRLRLPEKAIRAAEEKNLHPELLYCLELLEETGISLTAGYMLKQAPGTFHLRFAILFRDEKKDKIFNVMRNFHERFLNRYKDDL